MYRAPSKRRQLTQRIIVYSLMTLGVGALVTLLVFLMLGYRFNRETSTIQQGGLVQFNSKPTDANIRIGRAELRDRTPAKITVNPGEYPVTMRRDGYHDWNKDVLVEAGKVLWLNYAQLIPKDIPVAQAAEFESVAQVKASLNGRHLAIVRMADNPVLDMVRINGARTDRQQIELEKPVPGTAYRVAEWSYDNERLLVAATKDKKTRWLLAKRQTSTASDIIDLTARYGESLRDVRFDPRGNERLVVRTDGNDLRLLNVSEDAMSSIIVPDVEHSSFYGTDHIFYVSRTSKESRSFGYVSFSDTANPRELKQIKETGPVKVAAAAYFNDPHVAIATGTMVEIYRLSGLPASGSEEAITMETLSGRTLPTAPRFLSIRSGGRFVMMQHGGGFATYDIELEKHTMTSLNGDETQELRWLDRYHPYVTDGKQLLMMEFDGANQHALATLTTRFDAVQTDDGKYVYAMHKTDDAYELRRYQLNLN